MCYDDQARAPIPPGEARAIRSESLVLTAGDGNRFAAYAALPEGGATAQVLILPDVRGLHAFYQDLADRLAQTGVAALAMDYFGRTAGVGARDESFDFWPHARQLTVPTVLADARAGLAELRARAGADGGQYTLGFCVGGSLSFFCGAEELGLAGIVAFYSGLTREIGPAGSVLDNAARVRVPVLGLFGGADQGIPVEAVHTLDERLDEASIDHTIVIYPDAPHSFFDRRATEFADASADAWQRVLGFLA
ncbi:MAG TPA: dienelactone hydrolase family protein [Roseiflexaceae bacterium]|nr:dienelactone hydrolase family protein [Roseiflexaceae bacterium]